MARNVTANPGAAGSVFSTIDKGATIGAQVPTMMIDVGVGTAESLVTAATGLPVNLVQVVGATISQGHGLAATAIRVELPTDGTGVVGLIAGTAIVGKVGIDQTTPGTTNGVQVNAALPTGSNNVGHVTPDAGTTGGWTPGRYISAAGANQDATQIKASAGQLGYLFVSNINAAVRYLKLYDKASGVTSADTPVHTFMIPGNAAGAGVAIPFGAAGANFANGIQFRFTVNAADNDANAVAAGDIILNWGSK